MSGLLQDLRYAARQLRKSPGFTLAVVLTLALGIGANVAVFSVVEAGKLRSWPGKNPRQLAQILANTPQGPDIFFSYADYRDLAEQSKSMEAVLAYSRHGTFLRVGTETIAMLDDVVSPNYFSVLGIAPQLGQTFDSAPATSESTVVISDTLWHRFFHADRDLVGKQIWLTGRNFTVIGIGPPGFRGLAPGIYTDLWVQAADENSPQDLASRKFRDFSLLGRLRPNSTPEQAQTELSVIGRRLAEEYPAFDRARDIILVSEHDRLRQAIVLALMVMAPLGLVLLICCANVAGLILARSEARRREIAVRLAIGAGRIRLVRQFLTESALLTLASSALGLVLVFWFFRLQPALLPPIGVEVGFDLRLNTAVLVFTGAISMMTAIAFGLLPALQSTRYAVVSALKGNEGTSRSARRFLAQNALVLGEIAISVVLLTASGLIIRSLLFTGNLNLGFDKQKNLIMFSMTASHDREQQLPYLNDIRYRLASLPGVTRVSYATRALLSDSGGGMAAQVSIPGVELPEGQPDIPIKFNAVSPEYFRTMGTRILRGRFFSALDSASSPAVAIVSATMSRRFWPGQDTIGQTFRIEGRECQIVGVAEDAKITGVHEEPEPYMYLPFAQHSTGDVTVMVETARDPQEITPVLRKEILGLGPVMLISGIQTLHSLLQEAFWLDQIEAASAVALSGLGTFLAALGLYGVIAHVVSRRQREIGIRMAMGARRQGVMLMVLAQGLRLAAIGTVAGLLVSLGTMRFLASMLYGVRPNDFLNLAGSSVAVILVAIAASYFPARRAASVDPMVALRYE